MGYDLKDLKGISMAQLTPMEDQSRHNERLKELIKEGKLYDEIRLIKKDQTVLNVLMDAVSLPENQYLVFCFSTERRKEAEQALKTSEARFKWLFEQSPLATIIYSVDGKIVGANPSAAKTWDMTADEVQWMIENYSVLQDEQVVALGIMPQIKEGFEGKAVNIPPVEYLPRDPQPGGRKIPGRWVEAFMYPIKDESNKLREVVLIQNDVTQKKKDEQELVKANERLKAATDDLENKNIQLKDALEKAKRSKELKKANDELERTIKKLKETQSQLVQAEKLASVGILTAGIGHEINNPLNYIQAGIHNLERHLQKMAGIGDKELDQLLQTIQIGVERISGIVTSLNRFNRRSDSMKEECDIHLILDNCLVMLHNSIKEKINVVKRLSSKPVIVTGNEGELHQVLINVLTNAVQAIDGKGVISVETKLLKSGITVKISDDGYGISAENLKKVTDPFFTTKAPGEGTGLGISIAASIIQKHKGTIQYKSEVGRGTTVTIKFPN